MAETFGRASGLKPKHKTNMSKKKKEPKAQEAPAITVDAFLIDIHRHSFWRGLASKLVPEEKDDWHIGELATALQLGCGQLAEHWAQISEICGRTEDSVIRVGFTAEIDRGAKPACVSVKLSYAEKYKGSAASDVPDPNQDQLPGLEGQGYHEANESDNAEAGELESEGGEALGPE